MITINTYNKNDNDITFEIINEILKDNINIKYVNDEIEIYDKNEDEINIVNIEILIDNIIDEIKDNNDEDIINIIIDIRNILYYHQITYNQYIKDNNNIFKEYNTYKEKIIINKNNINKEIKYIKDILTNIILYTKYNNKDKRNKNLIKKSFKKIGVILC